MSSISSLSSTSSSHLRHLNLREDLLPVADLIEVCFAKTLDDEGRDFLRHLRASARDVRYLSWLQNAAEGLQSLPPLYGFVWEEEHRIVGNLSLFPMLRGGRLIYWIANVAVHPDFQGRGIARQLTERALQFLHERGIGSAWLQVREDNPVAQHIYRAAGFVERMRRTTWQAETGLFVPGWGDPAVIVRPRRGQDWALQAEWLRQTYPQEVAWSISLNFSNLSPGFFQRLYAWILGKEEEHWEALVGERAAGFASWQASHSLYDQLWLAAPEQENEKAVVALLLQARQALAYRDKPLQVNFPADRAVEAFKRAGFVNHQTLIWMSVSLKI